MSDYTIGVVVISDHLRHVLSVRLICETGSFALENSSSLKVPLMVGPLTSALGPFWAEWEASSNHYQFSSPVVWTAETSDFLAVALPYAESPQRSSRNSSPQIRPTRTLQTELLRHEPNHCIFRSCGEELRIFFKSSALLSVRGPRTQPRLSYTLVQPHVLAYLFSHV